MLMLLMSASNIIYLTRLIASTGVFSYSSKATMRRQTQQLTNPRRDIMPSLSRKDISLVASKCKCKEVKLCIIVLLYRRSGLLSHFSSAIDMPQRYSTSAGLFGAQYASHRQTVSTLPTLSWFFVHVEKPTDAPIRMYNAFAVGVSMGIHC